MPLPQFHLKLTRGKILYGLVAALACYLVLAALALPAMLKSSAEKFVAEKTGHRLTIAEVGFNPFTLALRIGDLRLDRPNGEPLFALRELRVDLAASSLPRRTWVFDAIRLDAPQATVALLTDGRLNWSPFLDALKDREERPETGLPRVDIDRFTLDGGRIDFADRGRTPAFETRIEPLDLELTHVSTLPDETGQYHVAALMNSGTRVDWRGGVSLNPIAVSGHLDVVNVALARLAPYLRSALKTAPPEGTAGFAGDYRITYAKGKLNAELEKLSLTLRGLVLRGDNAAQPALAVDRIEFRDGRFDLATRRLSLGTVTLADGRVELARGSDGRFDVEDWLVGGGTPANRPPAAGSAPWQLQVGRFGLNGLAVGFTDHTSGTPRTVQLDRLAIDFAATAEVGGAHPVLKLEQIGVSADKLRLAAGELPLFAVDRLSLAGGQFDLAARQVAIERVELGGGKLTAVRNADGRLPLLAAFAGKSAAPAAKPAVAASNTESPWHYRVGEIRLADFEASLRDETVKPAAELKLQQISARVQNVSDNLKAPLPLSASLQIASGGRLEASGKLVVAEPSADLALTLADLSLKPARPYLAAVANLDLASGSVSTRGRATYGGKGFAYRGGFAVRDLRLNEGGTANALLVWKSLATHTLNLDPRRLDIAELTIDGLDTQLLIDQDKSVNVKKILKPSAAAPAETKPAAAPLPGFLVNVDRLHIRNAELDFADHSLALPFGTRIHSLNGTINGLSSRPGAPGQVELDGQVDDYGLARAVGQVNFCLF